MPTAPSTSNYYLGKGIVKFDRFDDAGLPTGLRDMGNAPAFTILPVLETLDHFSSREGIKTKDLSVDTMIGATVKFTLDEYDKENLALALLGELSGNIIHGLTKRNVTGELRFFGGNDIGPNYNATIWKVKIKPVSEVGFITEEWGKVDFEGEVLSVVADHPTSPFFDLQDVTGS
jgi:hypothetical protein